MLLTHKPLGLSSSPCWYPSLRQRRGYASKKRDVRRMSSIPKHNDMRDVSVCVPMTERKCPHSLPWWGRFHRGLPSLDQAFRYSSTLPWMCLSVSEPGSAHFQTWCSSSSRAHLIVNTHRENKSGDKLETLWHEFLPSGKCKVTSSNRMNAQQKDWRGLPRLLS